MTIFQMTFCKWQSAKWHSAKCQSAKWQSANDIFQMTLFPMTFCKCQSAKWQCAKWQWFKSMRMFWSTPASRLGCHENLLNWHLSLAPRFNLLSLGRLTFGRLSWHRENPWAWEPFIFHWIFSNVSSFLMNVRRCRLDGMDQCYKNILL